MKKENQLNPCPCGNQRIAYSAGKITVAVFCPDCGRFVETNSLQRAAENWNEGKHDKNEDRFVISRL